MRADAFDWIIQGIHAESAWQWIERLSWLVAIVGLPVGIYQVIALRGEQRRVATELARQPKVLIGFFPITGEHGKKSLPLQADVTATWQPGQAFSDAVELTVVCHNDGDRSAHHLLFNFIFPREMAFLANFAPRRGRFELNPTDGRPYWADTQDHMHPDDSAPFTTAIRIPARMAAVPIEAEVSMDDRPATTSHLLLRVIVHAPALP